MLIRVGDDARRPFHRSASRAIRSLEPQLLRLLCDPYESARAVARRCAAAGIDLMQHLKEFAPCLLDETARPVSPAESILATCKRHGIALTIDPVSGDLIVGKSAQAPDSASQWPSLFTAVEAHAGAVVALIEAGGA